MLHESWVANQHVSINTMIFNKKKTTSGKNGRMTAKGGNVLLNVGSKI
jgi:hypothetical protein